MQCEDVPIEGILGGGRVASHTGGVYNRWTGLNLVD